MTLNPHDSFIWSDYAWYLSAVVEHEETFQLLVRRERIEPVPPAWHWTLRGKVLYGLERWQEAMGTFERMNPIPPRNNAYPVACYGQVGDERRAREYWAKFVESFRNARPELIPKIVLCKNQDDDDRWEEGLRKAGISGSAKISAATVRGVGGRGDRVAEKTTPAEAGVGLASTAAW